MKARKFLKKTYREFHPTKKVWVEERVYEGYSWKYGGGPTCPPIKDYYHYVVAAHWSKRKDYSVSWTEKGRYQVWLNYHYFRPIRTFSERRDSEAYPEFVRPKRNKTNLPSSWDDKLICTNFKSWKESHKCRKQWMKNL